jgi:hypothetical protein
MRRGDGHQLRRVGRGWTNLRPFMSRGAWGKLICESATLIVMKQEPGFSQRNREALMSETKETKTFDTVDHIAVAVSDVRGTVDWYLKNFKCQVTYQDDSWALLEFANIRVAFVLPQQHPPHFALLRDPALFGEPKTHRDGTRSVYLHDPSGNSVEVLALK